MKKVIEQLKAVIRRIPLITGLPDSRKEAHFEATKELTMSLLVSTSPIWLGSFVAFAINDEIEKTWHNYLATLVSLVRSGELFIYCTVTVAPLFYIVLRDLKGLKEFPGRLSLVISSVLVIGVSFMFYGIQKAGVWLDVKFIFPLSYYLFVFSVFLYYVVKVYDNTRLPDLSEFSKSQEKDFTERLKRHRD